MAIHGIVTFLGDDNSFNPLKSVDLEFRELVKLFHHIPFCATFGVSCAGHFYMEDKMFLPRLSGCLDIIVYNKADHIKNLLTIIKETTKNYYGSSFAKIEHPFGPSQSKLLEIWEIRIIKSDCLKSLGEYSGGFLPIRQNQTVYKKSKKQHKEIVDFWHNMEERVKTFCIENEFNEFNREKRIEEIIITYKKEMGKKK